MTTYTNTRYASPDESGIKPYIVNDCVQWDRFVFYGGQHVKASDWYTKEYDNYTGHVGIGTQYVLDGGELIVCNVIVQPSTMQTTYVCWNPVWKTYEHYTSLELEAVHDFTVAYDTSDLDLDPCVTVLPLALESTEMMHNIMLAVSQGLRSGDHGFAKRIAEFYGLPLVMTEKVTVQA